MAPAISVVVPLYNKAPYLKRSLDSIAHQTFRDFEVLVVNDGSTDGGEQIAAAYADSRFRMLTQTNAGPGAARNRGIAESRGEWIAFLDADDEWDPAYLAESSSFAAQYSGAVSAVTCGYWLYPSMESMEPMWRRRGIPEGLFRVQPGMDPLRLVHSLAFMCPWSTLVRAEVVRRWGGFYEKRCLYAEDAYLWLKVLLNEPVAFQMKPLVRFHAEASGLSNNFVRSTPIEPFLTDPDPIRDVCPKELRPLLAKVFAIRAFKRACVLSYWGDWRTARSLRTKFATPGDWRLPYSLPSLLASNPLASFAGAVSRRLIGRRSKPA